MKKNTLLKVGGGATALLLIAIILLATGVVSMPRPHRGPPQKDMVINLQMRTEVIHRLIADLNGYYVFPEKAEAMERVLLEKLKSGEYDDITSANQLSATLTKDIQAVTNDRHLDVGYSEAIIPQQADQQSDTPTSEEVERMRSHNFGIEKVERLAFNIGYLDLQSFSPPEFAEPKLAAAMTMLVDTEALIIDLRANNGGDPRTVALLASYLFDKRTRLNDIYDRGTDRTEQYWTSDRVAGRKYGGSREVYLLTSRDTFSAAEDFAYALKNLKRATLIGASTGGGAHPGIARRLNDHFGAIVPTGRSISPITHTDWEGVGVIPNIDIDPDDALEHAQTMILQGMLVTEKNPMMRERIQDRLSEL